MQEDNLARDNDYDDPHRNNFLPQTASYYDNREFNKNTSYSKKSSNKAIVAVCLVASIVSGFLGGTFGRKPGAVSSSKPPVIYEAVDNTEYSSITDTYTNSIVDVVNRCADSVVEITTEVPVRGTVIEQYIVEGGGSGVVLTEDGYILTNEHVLQNPNHKITVTLRNGESYDAKVVASDYITDVMVLKIEPKSRLVPVVFGDSDQLTVGEKAIVIGNPLGQLGGTVTDGIISALDREIRIEGRPMRLLQTNAAINPGNSGGGLFNTVGQLVGLVNAKYSGSSGIEGLGFAIPSNVVKETAAELINSGYVLRPTIGVELADILDYRRAMYANVQELGCYVRSVKEDSGAQEAGVMEGDRLVSLNGNAISEYADVAAFLMGTEIGQTIDVVVSRGGREVALKVTLKESRP
ncbi:MAG: trypsin-like peptidase domain-containing protein [Eubacteriaceae bacterium]|nr:trypsin-like peptidase domain-containing protein [Eubacteriaceae bacterium]